MSAGSTVPVESLVRWDAHGVSEQNQLQPQPADSSSADDVKFTVDEEINHKIVLWTGQLWRLRIPAIVSSTNESLTDRTGVSGVILDVGGAELEAEIALLEGCRTGEAKITNAYNLPCSKIIHTVGPRYNVKYKSAAESALHHCYRNALEIVVEERLHQVAIPCVYTERKGYPREPAAHIALRTVRRFLERYGSSIETVVLCVDSDSDFDIYEKTLPLYFPRSAEELAISKTHLPSDIGDALGEPVNPDRGIRVVAMPGAAESPVSKGGGLLITDEDRSWTSMRGDADAYRDDIFTPAPVGREGAERQIAEETYARYLRKARAADLSDVARLNFIYQSGNDSAGRPVFVVVTKNLPAKHIDMERVMLYMILIMDNVVEKDYTIVYIHSCCTSENQPSYGWMKQVYSIFNRKYKKNLKKLYVVHPSWVVKTVLWFAQAFVSKKFWRKVTYVERLFDLFDHVDRNETVIPEFSFEEDRKINGEYAHRG